MEEKLAIEFFRAQLRNWQVFIPAFRPRKSRANAESPGHVVVFDHLHFAGTNKGTPVRAPLNLRLSVWDLAMRRQGTEAAKHGSFPDKEA